MKTKALFNKKSNEFEKGTLWACIDTPLIVLCTADSGPNTFAGVIVHAEKDIEEPDEEVGCYERDWLKNRFEYFSGEITMQQ